MAAMPSKLAAIQPRGGHCPPPRTQAGYHPPCVGQQEPAPHEPPTGALAPNTGYVGAKGPGRTAGKEAVNMHQRWHVTERNGM
jgi:hypothetical protein